VTEQRPTTDGRAAPWPAHAAGPAPAADDWSDERLVDGYRRNSRLLREYGSDERTIQALCAIEERLRAREIDPDEVVAELDG
jgi:hypothetical protein